MQDFIGSSSHDFSQFLAKKMTRREFLAYMGLVFVSLIGISSLIRLILNPPAHSRKLIKNNNTFGSGAYGGVNTVKGGQS